MEQNRKEWLGYLEIYGSDFRRWPLRLSKEDQSKVRDMLEFQNALDIDTIINATVWPTPSGGIGVRVLERINEIEDEDTQLPFPQINEIIKQPALFLPILSLFLLVGVSLGGQYNSTLSDRMAYGYFSIGAAYAYGADMNDRDIGVR